MAVKDESAEKHPVQAPPTRRRPRAGRGQRQLRLAEAPARNPTLQSPTGEPQALCDHPAPPPSASWGSQGFKDWRPKTTTTDHAGRGRDRSTRGSPLDKAEKGLWGCTGCTPDPLGPDTVTSSCPGPAALVHPTSDPGPRPPRPRPVPTLASEVIPLFSHFILQLCAADRNRTENAEDLKRGSGAAL